MEGDGESAAEERDLIGFQKVFLLCDPIRGSSYVHLALVP